MVLVEITQPQAESGEHKRTPEEMEARLQQLHMYLCIHEPGLIAARDRLSDYEESFIPVYDEMDELLEQLGREASERKPVGGLNFSPDTLPEGRWALEALIKITGRTILQSEGLISEAEKLQDAATAKRDQLLNGSGSKDSKS